MDAEEKEFYVVLTTFGAIFGIGPFIIFEATSVGSLLCGILLTLVGLLGLLMLIPRVRQWMSGKTKYAVSSLRLGAVVVIWILLWFLVSVILDFHNDFEVYAMPRTVTGKQSDTLKEYLSKHKTDAAEILIKTNQKDVEASEFASEIQNAIVGSGWRNSLDSSPITIPLADNFNPGCDIEVIGGVSQSDVEHDTLQIVRSAFDAAHIYCSATGEGKGNIILKIGRRPLKLQQEDSILFKVGRWLQQKGE